MSTTTASETIRSCIDRNLDDEPQSVIKVEELRTLRSDLANYVLTDQLAREYARVFERVVEAAKPGGGGLGDVGIWVSGFFGSGKSLFAKIAGHVLADTSFGDDSARMLFQRHLKLGRPGDKRLAELFQEASVYRLQVKLVAFDIMSQHMAVAERNVGLTFLRTFYQSLGLSNILPIAQAELELQRTGKYEAFTHLYATRGDQAPWEEDRNMMTCVPLLAQCLAELLPERYSTAELALRSLELAQQHSETQTSIDDVVHILLRWLDEQRHPETHGTPRLMFVADEVGAWAGRNLDRIEQLRAFVEALGRLGQGRIWMLVTSQEKLSDVLADQENVGANIPLLQRLEARFRLNVHLDSSEVGTVIADRVLFKKARMAFCITASIWSPQDEDNRRNTAIKSEASKFFSSSVCACRMLNPTGNSTSAASTKTTSSIRSSGITPKSWSIKSPCGSSTATPEPCSISCRIMLKSRDDLPVPLEPIMWVCRTRWSAVKCTGTISPRCSLSPMMMPSGPLNLSS